MKSARLHTKGFTLIASLLLLLLLSGIAIGLMMMVTTEGKVGGTDLQNNIAYHTAEGGIEKMSSDLATTFQNVQAPSASQICALGGQPALGGLATSEPTLPGVTWTQYQVTPGVLGAVCPTALTTNWGQIIGNGQNKNLWAQIIPVNMLATAALPGGQEVSMMRSAQVALIPVFQFGVFSDSDLSFFPGSNLDFAGPVHTNADLYPLAGTGAIVTFHDKVSAFGNIIRTQLPNGYDSATNYAGNVYIPTADGNCTSPGTAVVGNCLLMPTPTDGSPYGDSSVTGAGSAAKQSASTYNNSKWTPFSQASSYEITNGNYGSNATGATGTGATKLSMPFVNGTTLSNELVRREETNDSTSLSQSREYNMAQIRVLLSDDPGDFENGTGRTDSNNVRLANVAQNSATATKYGVKMTGGNAGPLFTAFATYNLYFATASNGVLTACNSVATCTTDWPYPPAPWTNTLAATSGSPVPLLYSNTAFAAPLVSGASALGAGANAGNNTTAPQSFILCPTAATLGNPPLAGAVPVNCPATPVAPYYYLANGNPLFSTTSATANAGNYQSATWNLIDGWLRVEYKDKNGNWNPVTNEWLAFGFARDLTPPKAGTPNPINPNAILLLQEPADRASLGAGVLPAGEASMISSDTNWTYPQCTSTTGTGVNKRCTAWWAAPPPVLPDAATGYWQFGPSAPAVQSVTQYNWYPINFYDAREGEVRNNQVADNSCTTNGVMNAVEIDVGNLTKWLAGNIAGSGKSVDYKAQNGYVLYFSDRRGMLYNPNAVAPVTRTGDAGLEDVINGGANASGTPDGQKEPIPAGRNLSPEDVNENGFLDNWGAGNLGLGFYGTQAVNSVKNLNYQIVNSPTAPDPFGTAANARIASCSATGRKNWVSGARHVLKLVDGAYGNVPLSQVATVVNGVTYNGGFTVASENPVYIQGDYNSNAADQATWKTTAPTADLPLHSAASIIADAVTLLSDDWVDQGSMMANVTQPTTYRNPTHDGYYRVAVAGGKNMNFPQPTFNGVGQDFGTDGGLHNFLRYLEDWSGQTLHYNGSLVSLFYSTYDTGIFKCCAPAGVVYGVPQRDFLFDVDFSVPAGLPPGTPMFKDVDTLSYRQFFAPRITGQ